MTEKDEEVKRLTTKGKGLLNDGFPVAGALLLEVARRRKAMLERVRA